jgi:hypothetical protein
MSWFDIHTIAFDNNEDAEKPQKLGYLAGEELWSDAILGFRLLADLCNQGRKHLLECLLDIRIAECQSNHHAQLVLVDCLLRTAAKTCRGMYTPSVTDGAIGRSQ